MDVHSHFPTDRIAFPSALTGLGMSWTVVNLLNPLFGLADLSRFLCSFVFSLLRSDSYSHAHFSLLTLLSCHCISIYFYMPRPSNYITMRICRVLFLVNLFWLTHSIMLLLCLLTTIVGFVAAAASASSALESLGAGQAGPNDPFWLEAIKHQVTSIVLCVSLQTDLYMKGNLCI